jgi:hypothetical protein
VFCVIHKLLYWKVSLRRPMKLHLSFILSKGLILTYLLTYGAEPFLRSCQLCSYSRVRDWYESKLYSTGNFLFRPPVPNLIEMKSVVRTHMDGHGFYHRLCIVDFVKGTRNYLSSIRYKISLCFVGSAEVWQRRDEVDCDCFFPNLFQYPSMLCKPLLLNQRQ